MKKLFIFLIMILICPVTIFASSIKITNIEVINTNGDTTYTDSTIDGLTANLNFKVYDIEDSIKYKITIKNESDTAFNIKLNTNSESDKYFDYNYTGDTKIEAGKEGTITVSAEYVKYLLRDDIDNSEYSNSLILNISSDPLTENTDNNLENPNTGLKEQIIFTIAILFIVCGIGIYYRHRTNPIFKTFIFLPLLIIPFLVSANDSEILTVKINSKINVKPFVIRFSPSNGTITSGGDASTPVETTQIQLDGGTTTSIYTLSDIIEYEIPLKYNTMYGTDAYSADIAEGSVDDTSIITTAMAGTKIAREDTEAIEAAKAAISTEGVYVTYFTTSRVTIYDLNLYLPSVNKTVSFRLEYDESTGDTLIVDSDTLLYVDAMNYILANNPDKLTCETSIWECTNSANETIITDDSTKSIDANYIDNLNQDFLLKDYDGYTYMYLKSAYYEADNKLYTVLFGMKNTSDGNDRSTLKRLVKISDNTYVELGKVVRNGTLQQDEEFVYYSYNFK